jgi:hypothetical protein
MGASEWYYFVPYQEDLGQAFTALQQQVLAERDYYSDVVGEFESMAELGEAKRTEDFWEAGTHSILDMHKIIDPTRPDAEGAIRPLAPDEVRSIFGADHPARPDFERHRASESYQDCPRWSGRCAVLYQDGKPHEIVFWGCSGD